MTAFDYGVITIFLSSLLLGAWRGLISEVLSLLAWVMAALAAWQFGAELAAQLTVISDSLMRMVTGYGMAFFGVLMVVGIIRLVIRKMLKTLGLTAVDRLLGGCFGLARGAALVLILVSLGSLTSLPKAPWWKGALLAPPLETMVLALKQRLPPDVAKQIQFR